MEFKKIAVFLLFLCASVLPSFTVNVTDLDFWSAYNDDNLKYYIVRALEANDDVKIASINSEIYLQNIKAKRADEMPSITGGLYPGYTKNQGVSSYNWRFMAPIQVNYEADIFLKNRDKTKLSEKDYEISVLDENASKISIAAMTGTTYFNIIKLDKTIEIQEKIVRLREKTYDLTLFANKKGAAPAQDVALANKIYLQGKSELIDLKKEREQLVNSLAVLAGVTPEDTADFRYTDIQDIEFSVKVPENLPSDIITKRPDYKKAEKNVERAGIDIRIAKKEFLPAINISGLALFNSGDLGSIFTTKNAILGLTNMISGDIFSGGKKISNLKIKKSQYEIALIEYQKINKFAIQEVNDALFTLNKNLEKYSDALIQGKLEGKNYSANKAKFNKGMISVLDLFQAEENLLAVKKTIFSNKTDCLINYIGLYKATGANLPKS